MPPPGFEPFLRAICDAPDDDTPRLVYADWLDENGDPDRAEFIRLQVAHPDRVYDDESRTREEELLDRHREVWRAELPKLPGVSWGQFRRGFVTGVTINTWKQLRRSWPRVPDHTPADELRIERIGLEQFQDLLSDPQTTRLRRLDLGSSGLGDDALAALSDGPRLDRLIGLTLRGRVYRNSARGGRFEFLVTDEGAARLLRTDRLPALRELMLWTNRVTNAIYDELRLKYGPGVRMYTW